MTKKKLLACGAGGSLIAAVCCFTPFLVIVLPALGVGAWLAWLDYVLLPALVVFLGITVYTARTLLGDRRHRGEASQGGPDPDSGKE